MLKVLSVLLLLLGTRYLASFIQKHLQLQHTLLLDKLYRLIAPLANANRIRRFTDGCVKLCFLHRNVLLVTILIPAATAAICVLPVPPASTAACIGVAPARLAIPSRPHVRPAPPLVHLGNTLSCLHHAFVQSAPPATRQPHQHRAVNAF